MSPTLPGTPVSEEELCRLVMIDRQRKVRTTIVLKDADGDEIPIGETVKKLTQYMIDKTKDEEDNACRLQVIPLMSQALAGGLIKLMGTGEAVYLLSDHSIRMSLIYMMGMSFYLLKWIQQHNIRISTVEQSLTDEDIEMYDRVSRANEATVKYSALGGDPKQMIRELLKRGAIRKEDLATLGADDLTEEETEKNEASEEKKSN
jgi:hypothetical protein